MCKRTEAGYTNTIAPNIYPVGDRSYFPAPLPDCLHHVSCRRYSPLSVEVVEKPNKCKNFLAHNFSWGTTPTVLQHIVSAIYRPPFGKVWLSSVCWSPSAKPGNDIESGIYIGWAIMAVQFEAVCRRKFTKIWDNACRKPLVVVNTLNRLAISCFIPKIYA